MYNFLEYSTPSILTGCWEKKEHFQKKGIRNSQLFLTNLFFLYTNIIVLFNNYEIEVNDEICLFV